MNGRSAWRTIVGVGVLAAGTAGNAGAATESRPGGGAVAAPVEVASSGAGYWTLPPVRVEATPLPDPLGPFPLATTHVRGDAIRRRDGEDLGALLRPLVGLRVSSRGIGAAGSGISIRGSTTDQVLVLVDGRRWQSGQGGGADLAAIPLDTVESVEVFRGGASAVWGSDAIGGAVHVRTRRPRPGEARLRVHGGSFGERSLAGDASARLSDTWRARAGGRWFETDADYAFHDDGRGDDTRLRNGDVRRIDGEARLEGELPVAGRLRLDLSAAEGKRGVPGSEEFPSPGARLEDDRWTIGARWFGAPGARWQPALDVSWLARTHRYRDPDAAFGPVDDRHENDRRRVEASLDRIGDRTSMRLAVGSSLDELDSTTDGTPSRTALDARAQVTADARIGQHSIRGMGALRVDRVRGFEPFWSPRIGVLTSALSDHLSLRASAGLSYRAPSFDELFWPARATAAGNPDLRAERGRDLDAGVAWTTGDGGRASVDVFVRQVDDLIQWIPGASGVWRPHNVGSARLTGAEAEASAGVPIPGGRRLDLAASGTYLASEDRSGEPNVDGRDLIYRPRWSGAASARISTFAGGEFEAQGRFVDDVFVTRANTKTLPGYTTWDLRYRHPVTAQVTLDTAVTNLGDRTARDFRDYPLPGRSWKFGLTVRRSAS